MSDERETRRAPHMEKFVRVEQRGSTWHVILHVGVQSFMLGPGFEGYDNEDEATFCADMLCIALDKIVKEAGN